MTNIPRKTQKIFAQDATNTGVFGSAADNTKILSNDLDVLQSKAAFLEGWSPAVLGDKKFPALEEFQAIDRITTQQIAYLLQKGIPEWDSGTTYYQSCVVRQAGTYQLYGSLSDDNIGHALSDTVNWKPLISLDFVVAPATETLAGIAEIATAEETKAGTDDTRFVTPAKLKALLPPTGTVYAYALGTTAPTGHVMVGGRTIGNALSNATERANADTKDLFVGLWNTYDNTQLPIQDSSGALATRGVSADDDFNANKKLPTLDARGRVIAGLDNMGGTPAGRLTGQVGGVNGLQIGSGGGEESHTLVISEIEKHKHVTPVNDTSGRAASLQNAYGGVWPFGSESIGLGSTSNVNGNYLSSGEDSWLLTGEAVESLGDSSPHNNVQPTLVLPYIMRL